MSNFRKFKAPFAPWWTRSFPSKRCKATNYSSALVTWCLNSIKVIMGNCLDLLALTNCQNEAKKIPRFTVRGKPLIWILPKQICLRDIKPPKTYQAGEAGRRIVLSFHALFRLSDRGRGTPLAYRLTALPGTSREQAG